MTAMEFLILGAAAPSLRGRNFQRNIPTTMTEIRMTAGIVSRFSSNWTVICLEVRVFLSGTNRSVVGIPFSIFSSSASTSAAVSYLLALSFSRHLRIRRFEVVGDVRVDRLRALRRLSLMLHGDAQGCIAPERNPAGGHLIQNYAKGIYIRPMIDVFRFRLLRRHVLRRPDQHTRTGYPFLSYRIWLSRNP